MSATSAASPWALEAGAAKVRKKTAKMGTKFFEFIRSFVENAADAAGLSI